VPEESSREKRVRVPMTGGLRTLKRTALDSRRIPAQCPAGRFWDWHRRIPADVLSSGPLPPPAHGASIIHQQVIRLLRARGTEVSVSDVSGGDSIGLSYHLKRLLAHGTTLISVMVNPKRSGLGLYVTGAGGGLIWLQAFLVGAARIRRLSIVYHHHSYSYLTRAATSMKLLTRLGGSQVTHVVLSPVMATELRAQYPHASCVSVCSNRAFLSPAGTVDSVNDETVAESGPHKDLPVLLGHMSNLSFEKGLEVVLQTFASVSSQGIPVELILAGPFADERAAERISSIVGSETSALHYRGPLDRQGVSDFMSSIDIFLFPSRYRNEAEPLVVLEALQAGVPVVAFDVGCLKSVLEGDKYLAASQEEYLNKSSALVGDASTFKTRRERQLFLGRVAHAQLNRFGPSDPRVIVDGLTK